MARARLPCRARLMLAFSEQPGNKHFHVFPPKEACLAIPGPQSFICRETPLLVNRGKWGSKLGGGMDEAGSKSHTDRALHCPCAGRDRGTKTWWAPGMV